MRALIIRQAGLPVTPNIELVDDFPKPEPGPGEVLVKTEASALNRLVIWVGGGMPGAEEFPRISGSDGCGRVEAVGEGVDEDWIGKRIMMNAAVPVADKPSGSTPCRTFMIGEFSQGAMPNTLSVPLTG